MFQLFFPFLILLILSFSSNSFSSFILFILAIYSFSITFSCLSVTVSRFSIFFGGGFLLLLNLTSLYAKEKDFFIITYISCDLRLSKPGLNYTTFAVICIDSIWKRFNIVETPWILRFSNHNCWKCFTNYICCCNTRNCYLTMLPP